MHCPYTNNINNNCSSQKKKKKKWPNNPIQKGRTWHVDFYCRYYLWLRATATTVPRPRTACHTNWLMVLFVRATVPHLFWIFKSIRSGNDEFKRWKFAVSHKFAHCAPFWIWLCCWCSCCCCCYCSRHHSSATRIHVLYATNTFIHVLYPCNIQFVPTHSPKRFSLSSHSPLRLLKVEWQIIITRKFIVGNGLPFEL